MQVEFEAGNSEKEEKYKLEKSAKVSDEKRAALQAWDRNSRGWLSASIVGCAATRSLYTTRPAALLGQSSKEEPVTSLGHQCLETPPVSDSTVHCLS
jgi:hypothetical protein